MGFQRLLVHKYNYVDFKYSLCMYVLEYYFMYINLSGGKSHILWQLLEINQFKESVPLPRA